MDVDGNLYTFPSVEYYYQAMKFYAADERFNVIANLENPDEGWDDIFRILLFQINGAFFVSVDHKT